MSKQADKQPELGDSQPQRGFTGYFIPVAVLNDANLRPTEKLLLAEIHALSQNPEGACWASNQHLAHTVGMSGGAVANSISRLRKLGYIQDVSFNGRQRQIRAVLAFTKQWKQTSPTDEGSLNQRMKKEESLDKSLERKNQQKECEQIWLAYPRRAGKPAALRAIQAAVKKDGFEKVLRLTKAFAKVRPDKTDHWTPWPQKFFNEERYNDDPVTWRVKTKVSKDEYGRRREQTSREAEAEQKLQREMSESEERLRKLGLLK